MEKNDLLNMPFDQYQRYNVVKEIIDIITAEIEIREIKVLDIGGYFKDAKGLVTLPIKKFLPEYDVVALDTVDAKLSGYVRGDGRKLPFRDKAFNIVTCLDVLEHIPKDQREALLGNLLHVAKDFVILSAPFYSENVNLAENILFQFILKVLNAEQEQLKEHITNQLPMVEWLKSFLSERDFNYCYFDSGYLNNWLLMMMVKHYMISLPDSFGLHSMIDRFYNLNFYETDQRGPGYRKTFVIAKDKANNKILKLIDDKFSLYGEKYKDLTLEKSDLSQFQLLLNLEELKNKRKIHEQIQQLQTKDSVIHDQTQQLQTKDSVIHEQIQQLQTKDSVIQEQAQQIQTKDSVIQEQAQQIQTKDSVIHDQAQQIQTKDSVIHEQTQQLQTKDNVIHDQAQQIQGKDIHIHNIESELNLIKHSKVWRIAEFFRRLVYQKLLGKFPLVQKGMLTISREGFRQFFTKAKRYLSRSENNTKLGLIESDNDKWIRKNRLTDDMIKEIKKEITSFEYKPKVSIIMPVYNTDQMWLEKAIDSVINQLYENWELCIAEGGSTRPYIRKVLEDYQRKETRIKVKFLTENKGIAGNSNDALSLATGEFIGLLDHDDELSPSALYEVVKLLNKEKDTDFIYTDEDKIDKDGKYFDLHFKPDWSPDYLRSNNYICHFVVIRRKVINNVEGFRKGFEGSQDYDLFLRVLEKTQKIVHIPKVLYHWRSHTFSAAGNERAKMYAYESAKRALKEHILRIGMQGEVNDGVRLGCYRIKYEIEGYPMVSIIIPTKDKIDALKRCIDSILQRSSYKNYEITIVDNQSIEDETFIYFKNLKNNPQINILKYDKDSNFSAINNYAAAHVDAEYIIFLNNNTEVISPDWIENMLEFAQRKDIGAVGALLYHPDGTVQHAGIIVGLDDVASYAHKGLSGSDIGYMGRAKVVQNLSAISANCFMTRKDIFKEMGGFDENYSHAYSDLDLCMKIRKKGYLIVYTPYAELYYNLSSGRSYEDTAIKQLGSPEGVKLFRSKWDDILEEGDPYYNPNLSLSGGGFSIKTVREIMGEDSQMHVHGFSEQNNVDIKVLIVSGIEGAPFVYRCKNLKEQFNYLGYHYATCKLVHEVVPSFDVQEYEVIILNRPYESPNIIELIDLSKRNGNIVVYSTDDLVTDHSIETYLRLDRYMSTTELAQFHQGVDWSIDLIKLSDAVIVSTDYLKSQLIGLNKRIYVLENALNEEQLKKAERLLPKFVEKKRARREIILGYFSGWPNDHDYDFDMIKEPLFRILNEYDNVQLRIVGYLEVDKRFKSFGKKVNKLNFVPFDVLPKYIADVDINLVPLESNPHKRSKSAIKFLEASVLAVPTIAVNLEPYNGVISHLEDGILCSNSEEWFENIQLLIEDTSLRLKIADKACNKVRSEHTTIVRSSELKDIIQDITGGRITAMSKPLKAKAF